MMIGSDFSRKSEKILLEVARLSGDRPGHRVSVKELNKTLGLERKEIKHALEYLEGLGYLELVSIGGPWLYGHVVLTDKGLQRIR